MQTCVAWNPSPRSELLSVAALVTLTEIPRFTPPLQKELVLEVSKVRTRPVRGQLQGGGVEIFVRMFHVCKAAWERRYSLSLKASRLTTGGVEPWKEG